MQDFMTLGSALDAMKNGHPVARVAWAPGQYVVLKNYPEKPRLVMYKTDGTIIRGGLIPIEDALADDYHIMVAGKDS